MASINYVNGWRRGGGILSQNIHSNSISKSHFNACPLLILSFYSRKPLGAEGHNVLLQSFELLPDVTQLFSDQQGNVWALLNKTTTFDNTHFLKNLFKSINLKKHPLPMCLKIYNYDQFY